MQGQQSRRFGSTMRKAAYAPVHTWRSATAGLRPPPEIVILGAQRAGTRSMHAWLCGHPDVARLKYPEVHYFDIAYDRGERWYRTHYPIRRAQRLSVESSPYMLFHPLAPARAARDLPATTRFVVLLRDPAERAVSHYWLSRRLGKETESLEVALALEEERLAGESERVAAGERSFRHRYFSYRARGMYEGQLRRWFDAVGRDRILVLQSEQLFSDPAATEPVLEWLGLPRADAPFPAVNGAPREEPVTPGALDELRGSFAPHNEALFELLGRRLWAG